MRRVNAAITDLLGGMGGAAITQSRLVREGEVYRIGTSIVIGPLTYWRWRHDFRDPMISRYCRGMHELERDRRKHR